jgi:hypothetical protein
MTKIKSIARYRSVGLYTEFFLLAVPKKQRLYNVERANTQLHPALRVTGRGRGRGLPLVMALTQR